MGERDGATTLQGLATTSSSGRSLRVFSGGATRDVAMPDGEWLVGRGEGAALRIEDPSVSRQHAIFRAGVHLTIEDLGSANGTRIASRPLGPGVPVLVPPGVTIELGRVLVLVSRASDTSPTILQTADGTSDGREIALSRIATSDLSVIVTGESGAGKEVAARQIHAKSGRRSGPFVKVSARALSAGQIDPRAAFEEARRGTLFLDEILDLDPRAQELLASSLEFEAPRGLPRIIASSRGDLDGALDAGTLSPALFYRIAHVTWVVPPLRARIGDLRELATEILAELASVHQRAAPLLADDAQRKLSQHAWPGNLRELRTELERALLLNRGNVLTATAFEHLSMRRSGGRPALDPEVVRRLRDESGSYGAFDPRLHSATSGPAEAPRNLAESGSSSSLRDAAGEGEYRAIVEALRAEGGNQTRAAKRLGISRGTLVARLSRYDLPRPRRRD